MYQTITYHLYSSGPVSDSESLQTRGDGVNYSIYPEANSGKSFMAKFLKKASIYSLIVGLFILMFTYGPSITYALRSGGVANISKLLSQSVKKDAIVPVETPKKDIYQPRVDPKLSMESRLKIASIGVDTPLVEATLENYEDALKKGIWRVSDFGTPFDRGEPTILVAHRYGYLAWTNIFRKKSSFYNLPKLEVGETVEVTWKQRKYMYEVYAESKGEEITDYSADLILYTCENLNSKVRIFKYARLLEI